MIKVTWTGDRNLALDLGYNVFEVMEFPPEFERFRVHTMDHSGGTYRSRLPELYFCYHNGTPQYTSISIFESFIHTKERSGECRICKRCDVGYEIHSESGQYHDEMVPFCTECKIMHDQFKFTIAENIDNIPAGITPLYESKYGYTHVILKTLYLVFPSLRLLYDDNVYGIGGKFTPINMINDTFQIISVIFKTEPAYPKNRRRQEQMYLLMLCCKRTKKYRLLRTAFLFNKIYESL